MCRAVVFAESSGGAAWVVCVCEALCHSCGVLPVLLILLAVVVVAARVCVAPRLSLCCGANQSGVSGANFKCTCQDMLQLSGYHTGVALLARHAC